MLMLSLGLWVTGARAQLADLPDAPSSTQQQAASGSSDSVSPTAPIYSKYIHANQAALPLSPAEKVVFGVHDAFSPTSLLVWVLAAGYEQILDGSPNYGGDIFAFTKRVGAAILRDSTETVFTDSVFAPVLREDPRYYKLGPKHRVIRRASYAITRTLITKTDRGRAIPNFALFGGDFCGSLLTETYYPQVNRGVGGTLSTFGGALGTNALGNLFEEFLDDLTQLARSKEQQ